MQRSTIELIDVKICIYCENKSRMQVLKIELQMVELDRIKKHHIQWRSQDFLSSRCGWVGGRSGAGQGREDSQLINFFIFIDLSLII